MRTPLVSAFFPDITQQIHSLRAKGVISCQRSRAAGVRKRAFRRSSGILCTTPPAMVVFIPSLYQTRQHWNYYARRKAENSSIPSDEGMLFFAASQRLHIHIITSLAEGLVRSWNHSIKCKNCLVRTKERLEDTARKGVALKIMQNKF
jgi:hypothetical protein